jgi:hypothetical protein
MNLIPDAEGVVVGPTGNCKHYEPRTEATGLEPILCSTCGLNSGDNVPPFSNCRNYEGPHDRPSGAEVGGTGTNC